MDDSGHDMAAMGPSEMGEQQQHQHMDHGGGGEHAGMSHGEKYHFPKYYTYVLCRYREGPEATPHFPLKYIFLLKVRVSHISLVHCVSLPF